MTHFEIQAKIIKIRGNVWCTQMQLFLSYGHYPVPSFLDKEGLNVHVLVAVHA